MSLEDLTADLEKALGEVPLLDAHTHLAGGRQSRLVARGGATAYRLVEAAPYQIS